MKKILTIMFFLIFMPCHSGFAEPPKPPAPVFHPVGVSAEDEEFVRSKILENAPPMPIEKEKPKVEKKKRTLKLKKKRKSKKHITKKPKPKPVLKKEEPKVEPKPIEQKSVEPVYDEVKDEIQQPLQDEPQAEKEEPVPDEIVAEEIEPDDSLLDKSFTEVYNPIKDNFFVIAGFVLLFPLALFFLMLKVLSNAKKDFAEERKLNKIVAEQQREEYIKAQKAAIDAQREKEQPQVFKEAPTQEAREEIIRKAQARLEQKQPEVEPEPQEEKILIEEPVKAEAPTLGVPSLESSVAMMEDAPKAKELDTFKVTENLEFYLSEKGDFVFLTCSINGNELGLIKLENAGQIQKIRKIDSKEDRDIYMVKLDKWRGLVEVKEDSARYLMDI